MNVCTPVQASGRRSKYAGCHAALHTGHSSKRHRTRRAASALLCGCLSLAPTRVLAQGDLLLQNRFPLQRDLTDASADTRWIEDQSREELAFGAEASATYQFTPAHALRFGAKYVHTIAGPNRGFRFDTETNLPTAPVAGEEQVPVVDTPSGRDNNVAVYAEDRFSFNEGKTDVFVGRPATTRSATTFV